jgi:hypothetical protein
MPAQLSDKLREVIRLEGIAKTFSESFVDTITAQIGANAHDPKLFVQTLMRKMMLQALHEATTPLVEENERVKKGLDEAKETIAALNERVRQEEARADGRGNRLAKEKAESDCKRISLERDQLRTKNEN